MKNKIKILTLVSVMLLGFTTNAYIVRAEEGSPQTEENIPVPPNGTPEGTPGLPEQTETEPDKIPTERENQENIQKEVIKKPINTPASVTGEKYAGSGTVIDFTSTGSKAFYTIKAMDNTLYYLIIDLDKTENNVYFLSEINGEELSLSQVTGTATKPQNPTTPQPTKKDTKEGSSDLIFYGFVGLAGAGFIAYYYFFKIKKNKFGKKENQEKPDSDTEDVIDVYDDEDSYELDE
ncbi:DUF4366 domain-containing protein [Erysipelothrix rhusiopathiae]|nr:DUF4366 domain-containing protein [Erysipelothrix rhusiopathiae]